MTGQALPIACLLPGPEQAARREQVVKALFAAVRQARELPDGYGLEFPGNSDWLLRLTEFVAFERVCCPFFTFELVCEPEQGPIWLNLRGPEGVKEMVRVELEESFP